MTRRILQPVIFLLLVMAVPPLQAQENAYDVVGKAIVPLANIFATTSRSPNRAFTATLVLQEATGLPSTAAGTTIDLSVQYPDKARIHTTVQGEEITLCRNGQQLWAYPGAKAEALINLLVGQTPPSADGNVMLSPFRLPFPDKQLVFLPVLFQVQDSGNESVEGVKCRVLDLRLMPELARSLKAEHWAARIWVRPDYTLARLELARPQWHAIVLVKKLDYAPFLPPETWQPTHDESMDVLQLTPARYKQLFDGVVAGWANYKTGSPQ